MVGRFFMLAMRLFFLLAFVLLEQASPKGWLKAKPVDLTPSSKILVEKPNSNSVMTGFPAAMNQFDYDIIRSRPRPSSSKSCPLFTKSKSSNGNLSGRTPSRSLSTSASAGPKSILGRPKSVKKSTSKAVVFDFSIAATKPSTPRVEPSDKKTPKAKGVSNKTIVAAAITPEITPEIAIFKPDVRDETDVVVGETPEVKEETPEVKEETPEVKEETPEVKEETLEVKEETLEVKGETLEVKGETLEVKGETLGVKGETLEVKGETLETLEVKEENPEGQVSDVADTFPKEDIPAVQEENVIIDTLQTDEQSVSDMNHTQQSAETDSVEIAGVIDVPILPETQPMAELEGATLPIPSEAIQTALSDADIAAASDTIPTSPSEITISGDATELPTVITKVPTFDLLPPTTPTESGDQMRVCCHGHREVLNLVDCIQAQVCLSKFSLR
ncbi:hypothetical protein BC937DRAFT_94250 [Endogone sp. FLAS-F59071]|nr:hypothetical protein BC937DRAFT_94250 [Endogone sp. FLAS-F59071]|eukprot:RUS14166.1 hypothetical protein BC937DRAFT_94250 [Endogone sp. FLAS-F59071]